MALRFVSIGSAQNVHVYDDAGLTEYGIETDGKMSVGTAPAVNDEVVRLQDIVAPGTGVSAAAVITDHRIVRGDGGGRGVQDSLIEISDTGQLTLITTARVIQHVRVGAGSWKLGAAAPGPGFLSVWPILSFATGADEEAHYSLIVPHRIAAGTVINVSVDWCHQHAADAGDVCWGMEYRVIQPGEDVTGATSTILGTSPGTHGQHELVRTPLTTGIVGAVAHDIIGLRLYRDVSGDNLGVDADMIQLHFMFTVDKLGEPI